jgi:hypothetical protein
MPYYTSLLCACHSCYSAGTDGPCRKDPSSCPCALDRYGPQPSFSTQPLPFLFPVTTQDPRKLRVKAVRARRRRRVG